MLTCRMVSALITVGILIPILSNLMVYGIPKPKEPWEHHYQTGYNRPESWTDLGCRAFLCGIFFGAVGFMIACAQTAIDFVQSYYAKLSPSNRARLILVRKYVTTICVGFQSLCSRLWDCLCKGEPGDYVAVNVQLPIYANAEHNPRLISPYYTARQYQWVPRQR